MLGDLVSAEKEAHGNPVSFGKAHSHQIKVVDVKSYLLPDDISWS